MQKDACLHENWIGVLSNPLKTHAHFQSILQLNINMIIMFQNILPGKTSKCTIYLNLRMN